MGSKGIPIIIAAPSGAGKTSLVNALIEKMPNLMVSISHTTRPMRPGEIDGANYHFIKEEEFKDLIEKNIFLEYAKVFNHYYGTSRQWVEAQLAQGIDVIFEVDWQGAEQIRKRLPDAISIFILPPSHHILHERLRKRAQDDEAIIAKRMEEARSEISHYQEFDYLVVNDSFELALHDLLAIIRSQRLLKERHSQELASLLANLLA